MRPINKAQSGYSRQLLPVGVRRPSRRSPVPPARPRERVTALSSFVITLDTYSHVLPTMRQSAVRVLEETLK